MAASKTAGSDVSHVVNPDGSHSIGATIGGVFIPFATLEGFHVDDRVEAGKSPEAKAAGSAPSEEDAA